MKGILDFQRGVIREISYNGHLDPLDQIPLDPLFLCTTGTWENWVKSALLPL